MGTQLPTAVNISPDLASQSTLKGLSQKLKGLDRLHSQEGRDAFQKAELRKAAEGFEAMLMNQLLKEMMPKEGGFFGDGLGSDTYQQLFIDELSTLSAKTGQLGLADQIERDVAARAGLTEESENRKEPIPGSIMGRPLPRPVSSYNSLSSQIKIGDARAISGNALKSYMKKAFQAEMPLEGILSSDYGIRKDPFTKENRHHKGIDIAAPQGSDIKAAAEGKVSFSGWKPGYGNMVIIEHSGGYETRYAHNSDNKVRKGDIVRSGQVVAEVGQTGRATGAHLHFEVRKDGQDIDPNSIIACGD